MKINVKQTLNPVSFLLAIVIVLCIAAATPVRKISEYPTTTTNDVTDLFLLARTNDVSAATNYNIKYSAVRKGMTNAMPNDAAMTAAILTATNYTTTNLQGIITVSTNYTTTNLQGIITISTNQLSTNILGKTIDWTPRTNNMGYALYMQFVLDDSTTMTDFWITNSLAATNSVIVVANNGKGDDPNSFVDSAIPVAASVPSAGLIRVHFSSSPDNNVKFSVHIVP